MSDDLGSVRMVTGQIDVPNELLMAYGVIPDTRPPRPPLPWRMRLRRQVNVLRGRLAYKAFRLIAGYEVPATDEDW